MNKYVEGIVFAIIGLVVFLAAILTTQNVAAAVVGGLFLVCGIFWIVMAAINKKE